MQQRIRRQAKKRSTSRKRYECEAQLQKWDGGEGVVNHLLLVRNWKWQNTGRVLAVTKRLVGKWKGWWGNFPAFVW